MTQPPDNFGPPPLNYAAPLPADSRWGKGFLAVCGTFVFWGVGHWIAGYRRRGLLWLLTSVVIFAVFFFAVVTPALNPIALFIVALEVILYTAVLIDAFLRGRRSWTPMLGSPARRYLAGFGLLVLTVIVSQVTHSLRRAAFAAAGEGTYPITTSAMVPNLLPGDRILTNRVGAIHRWELVVFHPPRRGDVWTRRVVGLPGETIEIAGGQIRLNGKVIARPAFVGAYSGFLPLGVCNGCMGNPIRLGPDEYFLLGDNSPASYDSRWWKETYWGHQPGAVPQSAILGRVTAIFFPLKRMRQFK